MHTGLQSLSATELGKRYLAVHMRMIHPSVAYSYVGSDYQKVKMRTHSPGINAYCEERMVDVPLYVHLMKDGYPNRPPTEEERARFPALEHFRENMMPRPVGEEAWVDYERKDHWKARAYFIGLNWKEMPQFYQLAEAIWKEDASNSNGNFGDFYSALLDYKPYKNLEAQEIGDILNELHLENDPAVQSTLLMIPEVSVEVFVDSATHGDVPEKEPISFKVTKSTESVGEDIQFNEHFQNFRRAACLNATFSPQKIVKQMIFSSLKLPVPEALLPLSRPVSDNQMPPVPKEAWPILMGALNSMNIKRHVLDETAPFFRDFLSQGGEADALETLKATLTLHHPEIETTEDDKRRHQSRMLKEHPKIEESVLETLIKI